MSSQDLQTIRGYVQALPGLSGQEDAAKVAVVAEDGTEYHVLHKHAGMDLVDYINADVEVHGLVCEGPEGAAAATGTAQDDEDEARPLFFSVRKYTLADGFDDPWYDDDV